MTGQNGSAAAKLALVGVAALLLALGGCGRKGGLDLPPTAGVAPQPGVAEPASTQVSPQVSPFEPVQEDKPRAAPGQKRRIIIDPILD